MRKVLLAKRCASAGPVLLGHGLFVEQRLPLQGVLVRCQLSSTRICASPDSKGAGCQVASLYSAVITGTLAGILM